MNEIHRSKIERAIEFMYGQKTQAANLFLRNTDERVIELINRIVDYCDLAIDTLRAELTQQENAPLTWNEHINQMTVEEKADVAVILSKRCARALEKESCPDLTCWQCFIEFLNSPYIEGEKK